ncbi:MAG: hypothetical protein H6993_11415 [Pseudomonadales bacterium]|nr:hypothetical protein [Pseudomonadales bacterium]MCP5184563.1 hypothetical protein [Pseudomonadales bacterium]
MARVRLEPSDEYMHPLEAAANFNESMYFNVFDRQNNVGGWFRLANRPNEGRGEMTCCLYLPDGRIGFMFRRPERRDNDAFDGGGMRFEVVEPFRTLKVTFEGKVCLLTNPQDMADPSTAFRNNPSVPSSVRLTFTGISPMFGGEPVNDDGSPIEQKADEGFARGHYEQHMRGTGEIRVGDETFTIDGLGLRDHSWGPRFWQSIYWYRWLPMVFDESFAMMVSIVCRRPGEMHAGGMVLRDGEYVMIREATVTADYDDNQNQTTMRITARTDEREYTVDGRVISLIPLRNRRQTPDGESLVTRITEGMTEFTCDGRTGYGLSEFLDQIVDGRAVGMEA